MPVLMPMCHPQRTHRNIECGEAGVGGPSALALTIAHAHAYACAYNSLGCRAVYAAVYAYAYAGMSQWQVADPSSRSQGAN